MKHTSKGDLVLHFYRHEWPDGNTETRLVGHSVVARPCEEIKEEPPSPGAWTGMSPYYKVTLERYSPFPKPLPLRTLLTEYASEIRAEIMEARPRFFPFNTYGNGIRTVQGIYIARVTERLYGTLHEALQLEQSGEHVEATQTTDHHHEYVEGRRLARERYFFSRNAELARQAKALLGYQCQVCNFDFSKKYGELGSQYIDCHHLNPLSERSEEEWTAGVRTSLKDVAVLCANCHRMVHRKRPALSLDELRAYLRKRL